MTEVTTVKTPLTEQLLQQTRLLRWVYRNDYYDRNEILLERWQPDHNPRAYWYFDKHWVLSITSAANNGEEYYLDVSPSSDGKWFCWLTRGRWSISFLHLRHIRYVEDLQELCWAIARLRLFASEAEMNAFAETFRATSDELKNEQSGL